jgi:hypothetical protein
MEASQYGDEKMKQQRKKIMYKLDQAFGIIMHAHDDFFSIS